MQVIGLTGGIASGKSTVSRYLSELGAVIIDADILSRHIVDPYTPAWMEIKEKFGTDVFDKEDNLDRKKMAELIFQSPLLRETLNSIIHPKVIKAVQDLIEEIKKDGSAPLIVVDAPLLIEAGMTSMVDEIWVISIPEEVQIERLIKRDGISRDKAIERLRSQMPLKDKLSYADHIIENEGNLEQTYEFLEDLFQAVKD